MECEFFSLIFLSLKIQFPYSGCQIPDRNCGASGIASLTSAKCQVLLSEFVIDIPVKVANNWCVNKYKTIFYWRSITPSQTCSFLHQISKLNIINCLQAKNVCKPDRFLFLSLSLSWFSSRKRYNCNIKITTFVCFADSGYSTAYRRGMCRWQAIFIHFPLLESVERRSLRDARSSLDEPKEKKIHAKRRHCSLSKAWPWNSCASFSFSLVKCYYHIKFWVWAVLTSVL